LDQKTKIQNDLDAKYIAYDKLMNAKAKREEAEHLEQQKQHYRDLENESKRRQRDLKFEKQDLQATLDDPESLPEDTEWAMQRLTEIDDEITNWEQQETDSVQQLADFENEQIRIKQERE
jgi:hypothetical protein